MTGCLPVGLLGIGAPELLVVLAVALVLFGPRELPKIARSMGRFMAHLRSVSDDFQSQVMRIGEEAPPTAAGENPAAVSPGDQDVAGSHCGNNPHHDGSSGAVASGGTAPAVLTTEEGGLPGQDKDGAR
ncbi:MAG: twin-arginine translocase TatA/TatE family subunit [bacterium]